MNSNSDIKILRKRFTERRKQEIWEYYLFNENYAETANQNIFFERVDLEEIVKSTILDVKLSDKGNHSGAGRLLAYPKDVENELGAWILQLLDFTYPFLC